MSIVSDLQLMNEAQFGRDMRPAICRAVEGIYGVALEAEGKAKIARDSASAYAQQAQAEKQLAQQAKQQAQQAAQQAMSTTPEGYEDLVGKVNSIYRETASDFAIIGTSEGSALAHTIYGMSVQDGTPTPDNPIDVKSAKADYTCEGKNLVRPLMQTTTRNGVTCTRNNDGTYTLTGELTGANAVFAICTNIKLKLGSTYKLVGCPKGGGTSANVKYKLALFNDATTNQIRLDTGDGAPLYIHDGTYDSFRVQITIYDGATIPSDGLTFKPMLTLDTNAKYDDYLPNKYVESTTDLTLRAIEVSSDKVFNLVKDGKYYIADTVDWDEDKGYVLTRRINHITFNGSESDWRIKDTGTAQQRFFSPTIPLGKYSDIKSNRFVYNTDDSGTPLWGWSYVTADLNRIAFRDGEHIFAEISDLKAWLAEHPATFDYILATPIVEPITPQQAQALLSLKTYDDATSIMVKPNEVAPVIDLEYSKDRMSALALTGHNVAYKNALKTKEVNIALMEFMAEQEAQNGKKV